jgi:hypothetical protein
MTLKEFKDDLDIIIDNSTSHIIEGINKVENDVVKEFLKLSIDYHNNLIKKNVKKYLKSREELGISNLFGGE